MKYKLIIVNKFLKIVKQAYIPTYTIIVTKALEETQL